MQLDSQEYKVELGAICTNSISDCDLFDGAYDEDLEILIEKLDEINV